MQASAPTTTDQSSATEESRPVLVLPKNSNSRRKPYMFSDSIDDRTRQVLHDLVVHEQMTIKDAAR